MSHTLELPQSSVFFIAVGVLTNLIALYFVSGSEHVSFFLVLSAVVVSGFLADLITALAHFGFDYVIPGGMPIFGPIAREFRKHHEAPGLSPSNYAMNFTKGAYGSFPIAVLVICLAWNGSESALSFFLLATLMGISIWALFFHQIHSYAHMGSLLPAAEFNKWTDRIQHLSTEREQT